MDGAGLLGICVALETGNRRANLQTYLPLPLNLAAAESAKTKRDSNFSYHQIGEHRGRKLGIRLELHLFPLLVHAHLAATDSVTKREPDFPYRRIGERRRGGLFPGRSKKTSINRGNHRGDYGQVPQGGGCDPIKGEQKRDVIRARTKK